MHIGALPDLDRLRQILAEQRAASPDGLDGFGLFLTPDLAPSGYSQTPVNSRPFAHTGGDGVHYGLVDTGAGITDASPVVMTVPMQFDRPNLIVGDTLRDFLALGLRVGYFGLEGLQYDRDTWIGRVAARRFPPEMPRDERRALKAIEKAFALKPWRDPAGHLEALSARYAALLVIGAGAG